MTIASEITRLQNDKAAICTAIENKGVTVGAVTLDDYAACIDAIQQGGGRKSVDFLLIAGGGGGGSASCVCNGGGGGGAGGVKEGTYLFDGSTISVTIGAGGAGGEVCAYGCIGGNGGDSSFQGDGGNLITVPGGGGGGRGCTSLSLLGDGNCGGSGGGTGASADKAGYPTGGIGTLGTYGGVAVGTCLVKGQGGGGGGATGSGQSAALRIIRCYNCMFGAGAGGMGLEGTWGCKTICYAGGGGGGRAACPASCGYGKGHSGGGDGGYCASSARNGCGATTCGSGGGGGGLSSASNLGAGGDGAGGLLIIGYNCVCKDCNGFTCATGGDSCYTCGDCKFHCFTSNGTFTIVS